MMTHENNNDPLVTVEDGCLVGDKDWFSFLDKIAELASDEEVEWAKKIFGDDEEEKAQPPKVSRRKRSENLSKQVSELRSTLMFVAGFLSGDIDNRAIVLDMIKRNHPDLAWW